MQLLPHWPRRLACLSVVAALGAAFGPSLASELGFAASTTRDVRTTVLAQVEPRSRLPRPNSEVLPRERSAPRASVPAEAAAAISAGRRYELNPTTLFDRSDHGEIREMGQSELTSNKPVPLTVMREVGGFRREWKSLPLPGLEQAPPFLNCRYQAIDRSGPDGADIIQRDVKFWFEARPVIPNAQLHEALSELKVADVAMDRCPLTWGEAVTAAMGESVWSQVQLRPMPGRARPGTSTTVVSAAEPVEPARAVQAPPARPLSDNPIQRCDQLASHPADPEAHAPGLTEEHLQEAPATQACEQALQLFPDAPRLSFQLARAYLKAGRQEEGIERLLAAARQGHGASLAYLGDIHLNGGPAIEPDPAAARALYQRALEFGFEPARQMLAEFEDFTAQVAQAEKEERGGGAAEAKQGGTPRLPTVPPGTEYKVPGVMNPTLAGDLNAVEHNEIWSKFFLIDVASTIGYYCRSEFSNDRLDALTVSASTSMIDRTTAGGMALLLDAAEQLMLQMGRPEAAAALERRELEVGEQVILQRAEEAAHDGIVLLSRHGCASPQLKAFGQHAVAFIEGQGAPPINTEQIFQSCNRYNNKAQNHIGRQFCHCVTRKILTARVTRAERIGLASNFPPNAQKIANRQLDHFQSCR